VVAGVIRLGTFDCSGAAPCHNIATSDINVKTVGNGGEVQGYSCTAVEGTLGFSC